MALSFPNKESTDPAAKRVGQLQCASEHDGLCNTVFPDLSLLIKNLRRNTPDVGVTSGQKSCTKIIYIVLQTSVGLF